jgi:hypothetical protein
MPVVQTSSVEESPSPPFSKATVFKRKHFLGSKGYWI